MSKANSPSRVERLFPAAGLLDAEVVLRQSLGHDLAKRRFVVHEQQVRALTPSSGRRHFDTDQLTSTADGGQNRHLRRVSGALPLKS